MKLSVACFRCHGESRRIFWTGSVLDDGSMVGDCKHGHHNVAALQHPKFEILFECAGRAFLDGYYRETVVGIATAIERFFEFYTRVVCTKMGLSVESLEATWKPMSHQSERQRGAFAMAYLFHTKRPADLKAYDDGDWKKLRNDATHKGYVPTEDQAHAYGEWALGRLHAWLIELGSDCGKEVHAEASKAIYTIGAAHRPASIITVVVPTIVSSIQPQVWGTRTFAQGLEVMRGDLASQRSAMEGA